jgi:glycerol-3-phosphate acyltransferase PlsY
VLLEGVLWTLGGYLVGTIPTTYLVSRARRATAVVAAAAREASEADAHILLTRHVGGGWSALAAVLDVAKGVAVPLAARWLDGLPTTWVAVAAGAVVLGYTFPLYARAMAGRGLAAGAGVSLALLPLEMAVAGVLILAGITTRATGAASALGFALIPVVAAVRGQPGALVVLAVAIWVLILLRRLEGTGSMVRGGMSWPRALYLRAVWDVTDPASRPSWAG